MLLLAVLASCLVFGGARGEGVVYTRWGRTVCEDPATVLYTGIMAGEFYASTGGGTNYLCLHDEPDSSPRIETPWQQTAGGLYGVEFEFPGTSQDDRPFSYKNNGGQSLNNENPPCVVCYRSDKSLQTMIPGKASCTSVGMTTEYTGFLTTTAYNNAHPTEYICLDQAPEVRPGLSGDEDGSLLSVVWVGGSPVGSTLSPPYTISDDVYCAVCTM